MHVADQIGAVESVKAASDIVSTAFYLLFVSLSHVFISMRLFPARLKRSTKTWQMSQACSTNRPRTKVRTYGPGEHVHILNRY